jgi:hypothetical protein
MVFAFGFGAPASAENSPEQHDRDTEERTPSSGGRVQRGSSTSENGEIGT